MRVLYALGLWLLAVLPAVAELAVPPHQAWVTDLSGTLAAEERAALEARLTAFTQVNGAQVAVLMVPSTGEESIETFALRVAEVWKLGREGVDDGALLVVATADRRLRIEVGYGLEGVLTDATSNRIIDQTIVPHFKSGNLYAGINAGVERMLAVIGGEILPAAASRKAAASSAEALPLALFFALFFAFLFRGRGRRANRLRVPLAALASGGVTYLMTTLAFAAGLSAVGAAVVAALMGGASGGAGRWTSHPHRAGPLISGGGWGGGIGRGGFGGGFGGGGGGGFGGGGASGGW